ncbi:beta-N-acetylhexosaminidase [Paenibacillus nasutitermitis]|uniref:N-acetyl-beta-D-glucosaminidase n=1 Tax=Paenibacillus nasutitermitis TaxID=1652958 RepID=A0A916ZHY8_9BACL|nr:family 20 glycosylhydrolase [Paenibacillus nasutitermitis]GGD98573.1 N-acetyl-beta-D-glucosaminidase [Paenibacillus nasutitermitis]
MSSIPVALSFTGDLEGRQAGLDRICGMLGLERAESGGIPVSLEQAAAEQLIVEFDGACARIQYNQPCQLFRSVGLLAEALPSDEPFRIMEEPQFDTIGFMLDCSRNAVPRTDSIKKLLRYMALLGMNALMLYTEDTYPVEDEPYFGYMRGRYTEEELRECDDYAAGLGIELIPCIQTLAHLETFLKWEAAAYLRDTQDVLLTGSEPTYNLIERMIAGASRLFKSKRIHIGMDEAHGLGRGRSLDLFGYRNPSELIYRHLSKVKEITAAYGLKPMIWSDMFFRTGSLTHDYYDPDAIVGGEQAGVAAQDIQLVYWDYYHYEQEFYEGMIGKHRQLGGVPVFAGGIWSWLGMATHYSRTAKCSHAALAACKQEGVREVFATAWGDNGSENHLWSLLPGLQLYAEHAYAKLPDEEQLQRRIAFCTGIPYGHYMNIERLDDIPGLLTGHGDYSNPSKYLLWQDPLMGLFDKMIANTAVSGYYEQLSGLYREQAAVSDEARCLFEVPARLSDVLALKADLGLRMKQAYESGDRAGLKQLADSVLPELLARVEALRIAHRTQWMDTNKPFGWEVLDLRYGGLTARLKSAADRLADYLEGRVSRLEELEELRLYFDGRSEEGEAGGDYFTSYHRIASAGTMI